MYKQKGFQRKFQDEKWRRKVGTNHHHGCWFVQAWNW
jgi:hypothetical protein